MVRIIIVILMMMIPPAPLFAATYPAADEGDGTCSSANIQAAIDKASDGDTVTVPAGECTISTQINVTNKRITIQGNGVDSTILTANITTGTRPGVFKVTTKPAKITGFTFTGTAPTYGAHIVFEALNACAGESCTNDELFRVTGNKFLTGGYAVLTAWTNDNYGLIDNNEFIFSADTTAMQFYGGSRGGWGVASTIGTNKAVFVENNTFTNNSASKTRGLFDADGGARVVSRYNTITNAAIAGWHGYCGASAGTRQVEIYNNEATYATGTLAFGMFLRGGTGVVYNNKITAPSINYDIALFDYRIDSIDSCSGAAASCCETYPCTDQIGRGVDQSLDPMYFWNNSVNGSDADVVVYTAETDTCNAGAGVPAVSDYIQLNRDYYVAEKSGYTPYDCPHPLATELSGKSCDTTLYGTTGYGIDSAHDVTPSATNCTISPAAVQTITNGNTTTFTMTAPYGYDASGSGSCGGTLASGTYTTSAITANCTVTCTGQPHRAVLGGTGTVTLGGSGTATLGN